MAGEGNDAATGGGDLHPAFNSVSAPAAPPPEFNRPAAAQPPRENPRARGHSPARDAREQAPAAQLERTVKLGETEYPEKDVLSALAERVEREVRRASLPPDPSGYKIEFRKDFVLPTGVDFKFCEEDAGHRYGLKGAKEFALRHELDQETFSEMLELHAATQIEAIQARKAFDAAEQKKLGGKAVDRVNTLHTWFNTTLGEETASHMMAGLVTARQVEGFERIMQMLSNQGAAGFNQSGRSPEAPKPQVPAFNGDNFAQVRATQDAISGVLSRGKR